jgi:hypothetical protein
MANVRLRRFAVLVAHCFLLPLLAEGLVTRSHAVLSVTNWPLSYGKLVPPLEGGIGLGFAHRVVSVVAVLVEAARVSLAPKSFARGLVAA